jgi:uncharacterized protein (TIGR02284 family)
MQHESQIETLNDLIEINHDRIAGFERAIQELQATHSPETIENFRQYASNSREYVQALSNYVQEMGGTPSSTTTLGGKLHRLWMDIKNELSFQKKESALESCVFGDGAAIRAYEAALNIEAANEILPIHVRGTLMTQLEQIRRAHNANEALEAVLEESKA